LSAPDGILSTVVYRRPAWRSLVSAALKGRRFGSAVIGSAGGRARSFYSSAAAKKPAISMMKTATSHSISVGMPEIMSYALRTTLILPMLTMGKKCANY
jgi:hypothetical protein